MYRTLRIVYVCEGNAPPTQNLMRLATPADAAVAFRCRLEFEPVEVFGVICLSTKHDVLGYHEVSRGTLDSTVVHPREVFKAAVMENAASVIVGHNHPSGDVTPSPEDVLLTRRLATAGQVLGIDLLDHVVIGANGRYYSFRAAGSM